MYYFITFLVSYLIGTINPAKITAKRVKNIDISKVNSKNPGTSNIAITLGMKYAIIVGFLDIFKGALPVIIARILFHDNDIFWFVAGCSAILGHMHPFHMKFKGGKGTATFGGMVLAIVPLISLGMAVLFTIILFRTKFMALATLFVIVSYPIIFLLLDYHYISVLLVTAFSIISFAKHTPNFIKIYKKEEMSLDAVGKDKNKEKEA